MAGAATAAALPPSPSVSKRKMRLGCQTLRNSVSATSETMAERSEEHTSELQSPCNLVCRLLLEKKKNEPPDHRPWRRYTRRRYPRTSAVRSSTDRLQVR